MIFAMTATRWRLWVAAVATVLLAAGCGSSGAQARPSHTSRKPAASGPAGSRGQGAGPFAQGIPAPGPTGVRADPAAVRVIQGWSTALRHGDVRGAAGYFSLPSEMVNGVGSNGALSVIDIHTAAQAQAANATLPCGAVFLSADQRGRYVNALFRLTDRPGSGGGCGSGAGQTARTNFLIAGGRIVYWIRAPDDPGDNQGGPAPAPAPPTQSNPAGGGPVI